MCKELRKHWSDQDILCSNESINDEDEKINDPCSRLMLFAIFIHHEVTKENPVTSFFKFDYAN